MEGENEDGREEGRNEKREERVGRKGEEQTKEGRTFFSRKQPLHLLREFTVLGRREGSEVRKGKKMEGGRSGGR